MNTNEIVSWGREVVDVEIEGLQQISAALDERFAQAARHLADFKGKVVLSGVGKSGIIARKIAATMVSIGTPALFLHPVDGLHGDLGAVSADDVAVLISNSGTTRELLDIAQALKRLGLYMISITGNATSALGQLSDIVLNSHVPREACTLGLAPTASTTAQLALGDALAVVVSRLKGFGREDFKTIHPAGELGKQLMSPVQAVLIAGERVPFVPLSAAMDAVLAEMTGKKLGFTLVGTATQIAGIVTDGDLRRALIKFRDKVPQLTAADIMTLNPKEITADKKALDALDMMEHYQITSLIVRDALDGTFSGVIHLHDLLGRGNLSLKEI